MAERGRGPVGGQAAGDGPLGWPGDPHEGTGLGWPEEAVPGSSTERPEISRAG